MGSWLAARGIDVHYDAATSRQLGIAGLAEIPVDFHGLDLVIVAGGDGTLLSVARSAAPEGTPLLGVNFGSMGFLTELNPDETYAGLEAVLAGAYTIEERQMLRVRHSRPGAPTEEFALLNDAVITKGALARMITIGVRVDGADVATYTSDGLIIATPTGSTAYSLSAGGPILDPRMRAFVISPICPHTMTYRPLVIPAGVTIEVTLHQAPGKVFLTLDGQVGTPFEPSDRLVVDEHPRPVRLVRVAGRSFFEVLHRKLRWGER
jgi:NAD+ kinase